MAEHHSTDDGSRPETRSSTRTRPSSQTQDERRRSSRKRNVPPSYIDKTDSDESDEDEDEDDTYDPRSDHGSPKSDHEASSAQGGEAGERRQGASTLPTTKRLKGPQAAGAGEREKKAGKAAANQTRRAQKRAANSTEHALLSACSAEVDDAALVLRILQQTNRPNVNCRSSEEWKGTPLYWAAVRGHVQTTKVLLQNHADATIADSVKCTPLVAAALHGHAQVCEELLAHLRKDNKQQEIDRCNEDEMSALHYASERGHTPVAVALLVAGANANQQRFDGLAPLHLAAQGGYLEIVQQLIAAGAKIDIRCKDGATPLYVACQHGHEEIIEFLLSKAANPNIPDSLDGCTPFLVTIQDGVSEDKTARIVCRLLSTGANPNLACTNGEDAMMMAKKRGFKKIVEILHAAGVPASVVETPAQLFTRDVEPIASNQPGMDAAPNAPMPIHSIASNTTITAALTAAYDQKLHGSSSTTAAAIEPMQASAAAPAAAISTADESCTLVESVVRSGKLERIKVVVGKGAKVDALNPTGDAPLHVACQENRAAAVHELLLNGATVNLQNKEGRTPLHIAIGCGYHIIVKRLLDAGADVNAENHRGCTPLSLAMASDDDMIFEAVLARNPNMDVMIKRPADDDFRDAKRPKL